jgi:hypothetical protein
MEDTHCQYYTVLKGYVQIMDIELIAVDLAFSGKTGYAVINQDFEILDVDIFKPHGVRKKDLLQNRVFSYCVQLKNFAHKLADTYYPTHVYYEVSDWRHGSAFRNANVVTALGRAEASFLNGLNDWFVDSHEPFPIVKSIGASEVQKEIGVRKGKRVKGDEYKAKIAHFVADKFELLTFTSTGQVLFKNRTLSFDETDALAIAYVAMNRIKNLPE